MKHFWQGSTDPPTHVMHDSARQRTRVNSEGRGGGEVTQVFLRGRRGGCGARDAAERLVRTDARAGGRGRGRSRGPRAATRCYQPVLPPGVAPRREGSPGVRLRSLQY